MYRNIDECLRQVYQILSVEMSPKGNTQIVIDWCKSRGVLPSSGEFSQSEHHANAVMIAQTVSGCLNSPLLNAIVECEYGKLDNVFIIGGTLVANGIINDVKLAVAMLHHIYSHGTRPRRHWIMDKWNMPSSTFDWKRKKIANWIANYEKQARFLLLDEFRRKSLILA